jgi:hypothetical protein
VKLVAVKSANYARIAATDVMKSFLRTYPQIDGVSPHCMAIGAVAPGDRQQERESGGARNDGGA